MLRLRVEAEVQPTEDPAKVELAIKKIFPSLELSLTENLLVGESTQAEVLDRFHQLLRLQAIRDTARKILREGRRGSMLKFMLNKQAAMVRRVNFTEGESPLGPIRVTIESTDVDGLIKYLTS